MSEWSGRAGGRQSKLSRSPQSCRDPANPEVNRPVSASARRVHPMEPRMLTATRRDHDIESWASLKKDI